MPEAMQAVPLKVWRPLGKPATADTITSTAAHLGNKVAERRMHPSMFWPEMARASAMEAARLRAEQQRADSKRERDAYAGAWVSRWLEGPGANETAGG